MPLPDALRVVVHDFVTPQKIAGAIETLLLLVLIAASAWAALRISRSVLRHAEARLPEYPARTLSPVLESGVRYAIGITAFILMLEAVHVNVATILAGAGVAGLALGFGAQYLIRDVLAGVILLSEGAMKIGDLVRVDGEMGVIERITLRVTQIRKFSGELLTVPNGTIGRIGNLSRDYGRAIVQVTVPYTADVGQALQAVREAARGWAADHPQDAQGEPALDGVVDLKDVGMVLQVSVLVRPGQQPAVEPALRRSVLEALASRGIVLEPRLVRL
jgi:moderate conductance mechanosensitive channel